MRAVKPLQLSPIVRQFALHLSNLPLPLSPRPRRRNPALQLRQAPPPPTVSGPVGSEPLGYAYSLLACIWYSARLSDCVVSLL